jgi:hypothetical protein
VPSARSSPSLEAYPVLRWVPADASYLLVAAPLSQLPFALTELIEPWAIAWGTSAPAIGHGLRRDLGADPLSTNDLGNVGIDLAGSSAIVSHQGYPTWILPVGDLDRLGAWLDRLRPERNASVEVVRGHDVYHWQVDAHVAVSWAVVDRWFVVHAGDPTREGDTAWLTDLLDRGGTMAGDPAFEAAVAAAKGFRGEAHPFLVGLVHPAQLVRELGPAVPAGIGCLAELGRRVRTLRVSGQAAWDRGALRIEAELEPATARALAGALGPAAPAGYYDYRAQAALAVDLATDPEGIEAARAASACGALVPAIGDPVRALTGFPGPRTYHAAATDLDLDSLSGEVAVDLSLRDPRLVEAQLDQIPGRSFLESSRAVAGVEVHELAGIPGVPTLSYSLSDSELSLGVGSRVIDRVLARGLAPLKRAAVEIAHLQLAPNRLPGLAGLLGAAARGLGVWIPSAAIELAARRLRRYEWLEADLVLHGNVLALTGEMRLAR